MADKKPNVITDEMIATGNKKFVDTFKQIRKINQTDGSKDLALRYLRVVNPDYEWEDVNRLLYAMQTAGYIEGLVFESKEIVEPIRPILTDKAKAEIKDRTTAQRKANAKHQSEKTIQYSIKLSKSTDADIINTLESERSKNESGGIQGYIKRAIRKDIETRD